MNRQFRKMKENELPEVMRLIQEATSYLAEQGSPQWQDGFGPTEEMIRKDQRAGESYVLLVDNVVVGTAALISGTDPVYTAISSGAWRGTENHYASIHRVAVSTAYRGLGLSVILLEELVAAANKKGLFDVRIDTYPANLPMQRAILRAGFSYQGMVQFPIPHGERKAFQRLVQ